MAKVLIIDDNPTIHQILHFYIEGEAENHVVKSAYDGFEGIEEYKQSNNTYDLVFLDMAMPDMNGVQVFNELKELNQNVSVVGVTAHDYGVFFNLLREGMKTIIRKPVRLAEVRTALKMYT